MYMLLYLYIYRERVILKLQGHKPEYVMERKGNAAILIKGFPFLLRNEDYIFTCISPKCGLYLVTRATENATLIFLSVALTEFELFCNLAFYVKISTCPRAMMNDNGKALYIYI